MQNFDGAPNTDNHLMRHLIIGILISYRKYRNFVGFHGHVSHSSVVGVENSSGGLYRNNCKGKYYDENGNLKLKKIKTMDGKEESKIDIYDFRYRLIYHHGNMVTIKDWLNKRIISLQNSSK